MSRQHFAEAVRPLSTEADRVSNLEHLKPCVLKLEAHLGVIVSITDMPFFHEIEARWNEIRHVQDEITAGLKGLEYGVDCGLIVLDVLQHIQTHGEVKHVLDREIGQASLMKFNTVVS